MPPKKKPDRKAYFAEYYLKRKKKLGVEKMRKDNLKSKQKQRQKKNTRSSLKSRKGCCSGHGSIKRRYPNSTICGDNKASVTCKTI